jgi:transcriptional regulator with XRE-family HTH domain
MDDQRFEPEQDKLGTILARARARADSEIGHLAARAGVSVGYIAELEAGQRVPSATVAARIAGALNLNAEERALLMSVATRPGGRTSPWRGDRTPLSSPLRGWQAT